MQIRQQAAPSFTTKKNLYDSIDNLPGGIEWKRKEITLQGDRKTTEGEPMTEALELWYRDPIECVQELLANPMFRDVMSYAPKRVWQDEAGTEEVVDEMWTAKWWWEIQVRNISTRTIKVSPLKVIAVTPACWCNHCTYYSFIRQDQTITVSW